MLGVALVPAVQAYDPQSVVIDTVEEQPGEITAVVSAYDIKNLPMTGLSAANFSATVDGVDTPITSVEADSSRLSTGVVLLVDASGSMAGNPIAQAKQAMLGFVSDLGPEDQVAVMSFDSQVNVVQNFTSDHDVLNQAIANLTPQGDTALYDAVIAASQKAAESTASQRLVVLLSDGVETVNSDERNAALQAAGAGGVPIVAVGLGNEIDKDFLDQITSLSGGRLLQAATPAALASAYSDLATQIQNQYVLHITVPETIDRTGRSQLEVKLTVRSNSVTTQRTLEPLSGATGPSFNITVSGLKPGQKLSGTLAVTPKAPDGVSLVKVEYLVDDKVVHTSTSDSLAYQIDGASLVPGAHILKVVGTDAAGGQGETIVTFIVPPPPHESGFSKLIKLFVTLLPIVLILGLIGGGGYMGLKILRRRQRSSAGYAGHRIRPWASRDLTSTMAPPEDWPERARPQAPVPQNRVLGRIVVMDENAVKNGDLSAIHDYLIGTAPLTLGTGATCDIRVEDAEGRIAAEEARLWVQKGRLVYHKLTTLSAMATEGVTSGWLLLADGEDFRLGAYRVLFQNEVPNVAEVPTEEEQPPAEPETVDEETAHSLQEFEDKALQERWERQQAIAKAATDAPEQAPSNQRTLASMWSEPDMSGVPPTNDPAVEPDPPTAEPPATPVEDSSVPTEAGDRLADDTAAPPSEVAPVVNITDAWTRLVDAEAGLDAEPVEIDEETLQALKALEEASLHEPQRSANTPADMPANDDSDSPGETAWRTGTD